MISEKALDDLIKKQKLTIESLKISLEAQEREIEKFHEDLGVSSETISEILSDKTNFSQEEWNEIEKQKKYLLEKLEQNLSFIRNPEESKKNRENLNVRPHWLFVR